MALSRFVLILCLVLMSSLGSAVAQDVPIEITLVPGDKSHAVIDLENPFRRRFRRRVEPKWAPPIRRCGFCDTLPKQGVCRCSDPLTQEMAVGILKRVSRAITDSTAGQIVLARGVRVKVVSKRQLSELGGERLLGLYHDDVVWVNADLNRLQATAVIAHEYGHAWFFQRRLDVDTPNELLFEGFAEFVSFLALRELGDSDGANRIEFQDQSVYGRGARKLIALYRRSGVAAVVSLALTGARV